MSAYLEGLAAGPFGVPLAIALMTLATWACRLSGVVLMSRVRLTPRVRRALRALPGSIMVAVAVPIGIGAGWPGIAGLLAAGTAMALVRSDLAAILAGVGAVAAGRALGF